MCSKSITVLDRKKDGGWPAELFCWQLDLDNKEKEGHRMAPKVVPLVNL